MKVGTTTPEVQTISSKEELSKREFFIHQASYFLGDNLSKNREDLVKLGLFFTDDNKLSGILKPKLFSLFSINFGSMLTKI